MSSTKTSDNPSSSKHKQTRKQTVLKPASCSLSKLKLDCDWRSYIVKGDVLQAWDGNGWYAATVLRLDHNRNGKDTLLISFDNYSSKYDRWHPRTSRNIRPTIGFLKRKIMEPQAMQIVALTTKTRALQTELDETKDANQKLRAENKRLRAAQKTDAERAQQMKLIQEKQEKEIKRLQQELNEKTYQEIVSNDRLSQKTNECLIFQNELNEMKAKYRSLEDKYQRLEKDTHRKRKTADIDLRAGGYATLKGLQSAEYNGKIVEIVKYVKKRDRWRVKLVDIQICDHEQTVFQFGIKKDNLEYLSHADLRRICRVEHRKNDSCSSTSSSHDNNMYRLTEDSCKSDERTV